MELGHKGHLNTGNKFPKRSFPNLKISLPILDELEIPRFWGNREKFIKSKGQSHVFSSRLEVDDKAHRSTQTHRRDRRKTQQIMRTKIGPKIPLKIMKIKNNVAQGGR
jgi:hypothetical protein